MPFPNEHSLRLEKPIYDKYRRTEGGTIFGSLDVPKTISIIWGHINSEKPQAWHPQALRFPTENWSAAEAKNWVKKNIKNYISFTEATNENAKTFLKFKDFLNEMLITPNESSYLDSIIEFVKIHKKPANDKEFTEEILNTLKLRRKIHNVRKIADIYQNLIDYVDSLLKSKTYIRLNESLKESLEPDEDVKRGDIVTIYGKRNIQKKIGDTSFEMGGSYIGKKEYEQKIIVSEVGKNYRGKKVIYKAYFLDGSEVPLNVTYWYSTQSGSGQKYLHKYEK